MPFAVVCGDTRMFERNAFALQQRARRMRPDACRWLRPDATRWQRPVHPDEAKYNPNKPRVPAGDPDGGQWTGGEGGSAQSRGIDDDRVLSDADPARLIPGADYASADDAGSSRGRGGHHIVPQSLYRDWSPEARSVLQREVIGPIDNKLVQTGTDGNSIRHLYDSQHRQYNRALTELSERFLRENSIDPRCMTSAQAPEFRARVETSQDPRLRDYNGTMRALARATRTMRLLRGE